MSATEEPSIRLTRDDLGRLLRLSRELHTTAIPSRTDRLIAGVGRVLNAATAAYESVAGSTTTLAVADGADGTPCGPPPTMPVDGPSEELVGDDAGPARRLASVRRDGPRATALVCWRPEAFTASDAALLPLLHEEFSWVIDAANLFAGLPSENRVVLELLRTGLREKQIARRLDRSHHTIHSHIKRLYRRFDVSSRAQLLAKLTHQGPQDV